MGRPVKLAKMNDIVCHKPWQWHRIILAQKRGGDCSFFYSINHNFIIVSLSLCVHSAKEIAHNRRCVASQWNIIAIIWLMLVMNASKTYSKPMSAIQARRINPNERKRLPNLFVQSFDNEHNGRKGFHFVSVTRLFNCIKCYHFAFNVIDPQNCIWVIYE